MSKYIDKNSNTKTSDVDEGETSKAQKQELKPPTPKKNPEESQKDGSPGPCKKQRLRIDT